MARTVQDTRHSAFRLLFALLTVAACFLAGIGTGALLWRGEQRVEQTAVYGEHQSQLVSNGYRAADLLLVAADNLARERGLTYAALRSAGYIPVDSRDSITEARKKADDAFAEALGLVKTKLQFDPNTSVMRRVSDGIEALQKERSEIDGLRSGGDVADKTRVANEWFATSSRLLTTDEQLLELVHAKIRSAGINIDTAVALKLQWLAIIMIDFVGRERGVVAGAIAEAKPLDHSFSSWVLPAYRGRINGIWTSIKAAADSQSLSPEIVSLITKLQGEYFIDMEALRDRIQYASKAGEPYPITAEEWFAKATGVINSIVSLGQEAGQFARSKSQTSQKTV